MSSDWLRDRAEHFARIRQDPIYRILEQLEDMRAEMIPPLYPQQQVPQPEPPPHKFHIRTYLNIDDKALELHKRIANLESTFEEHTAYSKKKRENYRNILKAPPPTPPNTE